MALTNTDILISGGGVAGLTAAASMAAAGFNVILTDPTPPVTDSAAEGADLRTTAFLQPSRDTLAEAGLWERLAPFATPLQVMAIMDLGAGANAPARHAFDASDVSDEPFGWNLPNWLLRREMMAHLTALPNVDLRLGISTASVLARTGEARAALSDGARIAARLVIAADGRSSPTREAAGIGVRTWRYGQMALAFAVTHEVPHDNISTEIHRDGGPFTLVPLPDRDGRHASAVVWMERGTEAMRLAKLPEPEFSAAMTERSGALLGPLTLASRRTVWPIISQIADRFCAERLALIAEAAHVVPPIGAQGLNMSLADISALRRLAEADRDGLGTGAMLDRYNRQRHPDVLARVIGVDVLNRASMAGAAPIQALRAEATRLLHDIVPLRRAAMHAGMGHGKHAGVAPKPRLS